MRVFFIGICGTAMGNAALMLKKKGEDIAGSDAGAYPPMSDVLQNAGIDLFEGFSVQDMIDWRPDRVVVGNAVSRGNPQVERLLDDRSIPFVSLPQLIGEDLIGNRNAVVIAGTHGKTTTTTLTAYCLAALGMRPGYLIGGVPLDLPSGNEIGAPSSPFVIEGDEYDSAFFDKRSKFIHYRPRILALNNLEFDHGDIFRDLEDVARSFSHLLRIVPSTGFILLNGDDRNLADLPKADWSQSLSVGVGRDNDLRIVDFSEDASGSRFVLQWRGKDTRSIDWALPGIFNARNLAMSFLASSLARSLTASRGIDEGWNPFAGMKKVNFAHLRGVKRRQEVLHECNRLCILSDFAHHPTAISEALKSLRARWPSSRLIACFEPRSNTAVTKVFEERFADALSEADQVMIGEVHRAERIPQGSRIDPGKMIDRIKGCGKQGQAFSSNLQLGEALKLLSPPKEKERSDLVVFFSNGSFDGVIQTFAEHVASLPEAVA